MTALNQTNTVAQVGPAHANLTAYQSDALSHGYQPRTVADDVSDNVPQELRDRDQWVIWQYQPPDPGKAKPKKVPLKVSGGKIENGDAKDPGTFLSFNDALALYRKHGSLDGIGYAFTDDDPFTGVDLDGCVKDGQPEQWAQDEIDALSTWTEASPSGTGYHAIVRANVEKMRSKSKKFHNAKLEMYREGRFFTVTGRKLADAPLEIRDGQAEIQRLHDAIENAGKPKSDQPGKQEPTAGTVPTNVQEVVALIQGVYDRTGNAGERKFLAQHYGGPEGEDLSADDMGYFNKLAFYCRKDPELMKAVYRQSALTRKKSDRKDYIDRTIQEAIRKCEAVYNPATGGKVNQQAPQEPTQWPVLADPFAEYMVPAFPMEVLPEAFKAFCNEKSAQSGFDPGGYAFCLLTIAANTIDHRARLNLGPFHVPAFMWGGIVGPSGDGKSPILNDATRSADAINNRMVKESEAELGRWHAQCESMKKSDKAGVPPKPEWKQRHAMDTTTEALALLLKDNPEGVNLNIHEITEFIGRMDAYSGKDGGKDRGVYLRAYDGGQSTINRASKQQPLVVDQFSVGILAGMQPEKLAYLFKKNGGGSDGLYQRFLLYCLRPAGEVNYMVRMDPFTEQNVDAIFERISGYTDLDRMRISLSDDAMRLMQDYHNQVRKLAQRTPARRFAEHLDKFPGMLGRLAHALHIIDAATAQDYPERVLSAQTMKRAVSIMRVLYRHSEAVYRVLDMEAGDVRDMVISAAEAILSKGWERFKRGDLTRHATYWQGSDQRQAEGAIDYLIELGWIADVTPPAMPGKRGRRSDGAFLVNPEVHNRFSERAARIKQDRADRFKALQQVAGG